MLNVLYVIPARIRHPAAFPQKAPSHVPILLVDGEYDYIGCVNVTQYDCTKSATVQTFEEQCYPPQAHVRVVIIPDTGHDLALSTTRAAHRRGDDRLGAGRRRPLAISSCPMVSR